jgi:hypothetical protein
MKFLRLRMRHIPGNFVQLVLSTYVLLFCIWLP